MYWIHVIYKNNCVLDSVQMILNILFLNCIENAIAFITCILFSCGSEFSWRFNTDRKNIFLTVVSRQGKIDTDRESAVLFTVTQPTG